MREVREGGCLPWARSWVNLVCRARHLPRATMIGPNILLTIVVGSVVGLLIWKLPPPAWTARPIAGICLMAVAFVLWTIVRFQLGRSLTVTAQARQAITGGPTQNFATRFIFSHP